MGPYEKAWQAALRRVETAVRAAGRPAGSVSMLAVSKHFPAEAVRAVHAAGQRAFGENYVQEGSVKRSALADLDIEWRLIGPLQSNKARLAASVFDWVETVDRVVIADRLAGMRRERPLDVLVQVNISGEPSKSGVDPDDALTLARHVAALPSLRLRGVMGVGGTAANEGELRAQYRRLRGCYDACGAAGLRVDTLSMGMSGDLELAIEEGATEVRVGTAIFGARDDAHPAG